MKKLTVILLAAALVALPSCKNQNKFQQAQGETPELNSKEDIVSEELKANVQNLLESTRKMRGIPFTDKKDGKTVLSEKEKKVKPDYLINPAEANNMVTLTQKYRIGAMLGVDLAVAKLYDMSTVDINEALAKLLLDVNDEAFTIFAQTPWGDAEGAETAIGDLADAEFEAGRANFFWEATTACLVEQIYIATRDIDKFMPMFDDKTAADITYNFVCVHEGIRQMTEIYPDMASLNEVLQPLYVINAINKDQLRSQLTELKGDIENARAFLLK